LYDRANPVEPLPRFDADTLKAYYISERRGQSARTVAGMESRIPDQLRGQPLGKSDIELIELVLDQANGQAIVLRGPRGAGKTSLIHYVEALCIELLGDDAPIFIKINGLPLTGTTALETRDGIELLHALLRAELHEHDVQVPTPPTTKEFLEVHSGPKLLDAMIAVYTAFADSLPRAVRERVVFVFDNLDQLLPHQIECVRELAQALATGANIHCVVCLRPHSLRQQVARSTSGAFFFKLIDVPAPKIEVWLDRLPDRLAAAASEMKAKLRLRGVPLTPDDCRMAGLRLKALLSRGSRAEDDDALPILQALAADDTRRLVRAMRNIVAHRSIPVTVLLGEATRPAQDYIFHSLPALFEGSKTLYKQTDLLPNLLWLECHGDSPKLVIFHRILHLLGDSEQMLTGDLYRLLRAMDYEEGICHRAIATLINAQLVRGTDMDRYEPDTPPEAVYITEAGRYFRDFFMCNADYLLSAVTDMSLEHRAIRAIANRPPRGPEAGQEVDFSAAADSLLEYVQELKDKELRQIFRLTKRETQTPELRKIVYVLRKGGLLIGSVKIALLALHQRNSSSHIPALRALADAFEQAARTLEQAKVTAEAKLQEIDNKSRRSEEAPIVQHEDRRRVGADHVRMVLDEGVDGVLVRTTLSGSGDPGGSRPDPWFIGIYAQDASEGGAQANLAYTASGKKDSTANRMVFQPKAPFSIEADRVPKSANRIALNAVRVEYDDPDRRQIALLTSSFKDGRLHIRFQIPSDIKVQLDGYELSSGITKEDLTTLVDEVLAEVGSASGEDVVESLRVQANRLTRRMLSTSGLLELQSGLHRVKAVIAFVAEETANIPWEWLSLVSDVTAERALLCQCIRLIRWTADPYDAIYRLRAPFESISAAPMITLGLNTIEEAPWRKPVPQQLRHFGTTVGDAKTIHLVGHFDNDRLLLRDSSSGKMLALTSDSVDVLALPASTKSIILSGCEVANLDATRNLAAAFASRHGYCVWAPMVKIDETEVAELDRALNEFLFKQPTHPVEAFFMERNANTGWHSTYARFGFGCKPNT